MYLCNHNQSVTKNNQNVTKSPIHTAKLLRYNNNNMYRLKLAMLKEVGMLHMYLAHANAWVDG
jgi:hypothetical protein